MIDNVKYFLVELIDPKGKFSSPAVIGIITCLVGIAGHFTFIPVSDPNVLFWSGLGALGLASGETVTSIINTHHK